MLSNFNNQIWKNDIPGLLQILQGSDRFPGSIATLAGLDLLGVLEPLEQVDPVTYLSLVGVASLQGPVAPWNVWNSEFVKEVCNRAVTLFFLKPKAFIAGKNRQSSSQIFFSLEVKNNNKIAGKWDCWVCQILQFTSKRQNSLVLKLKKWFQRWDSIQNSI